jgi:hypothetical protein
MKPRLDSAPLASEDQQILANWSYRYIGDFWWKLPVLARDADRRDADLMLFFMSLGWRRTTSVAYLYLRLSHAIDDPGKLVYGGIDQTA